MTPPELRPLRTALPAKPAGPGSVYRVRGPGGPRLAVTRDAPAVFKAFDHAAMSATAVLTYPTTDLDGDFVRPDGGDWSRYPDHPKVDWVHAIPIGRGSVELKAVDVDGRTWNVPVGTTRFFQTAADLRGIDRSELDPRTRRPTGREYPAAECLRVAEQAYRLVADDVATGVSLEFRPAGGEGDAYWPTGGWSETKARPAYHFDRWTGHGWCHAPTPVNPHARTLLPERIEKCVRIAESGRIGGTPLEPVLLKAFMPFKDIPRPALVRVEKAMPMDDEDDDLDLEDTGAGDDTPDEPEMPDAADPADDADAGGPMKPTPSTFMMLAQGMLDLADQGEAALAAAEHPEGMARIREALDLLRKESAILRGDGHGMFPDAGLDTPDDMPADATTDDGGIITKAYPGGPPLRFYATELRPPVETPAPADPTDANELKSLAAELAAERRAMARVRRDAKFVQYAGRRK